MSKKKKIIIVSASFLLFFAIIISGVYFALNVVFNPQKYLEDGNYSKAYDRAIGSKKQDVLLENNVAVAYQDFKSKTSEYGLELEKAWIMVDNAEAGNPVAPSRMVIMKMGGKYFYYGYSREDKKYCFLGTFENLEPKPPINNKYGTDYSAKHYNSNDNSNSNISSKQYDSNSPTAELREAMDRYYRISAKQVVSNGIELSEEAVKRIVYLRRNQGLEDVKLLKTKPENIQRDSQTD